MTPPPRDVCIDCQSKIDPPLVRLGSLRCADCVAFGTLRNAVAVRHAT